MATFVETTLRSRFACSETHYMPFSNLESEVFQRCQEAITQHDRCALENLIEDGLLLLMTSQGVQSLWDMSCQSWCESAPEVQETLSVLMALMKAWHPGLVNPGWMTELDPEAL